MNNAVSVSEFFAKDITGNLNVSHHLWGARGVAVCWGTALQAGRSRVRFPMVSLAPGVDSASNRNEYQEYFLGAKGGRCVRLTNLPPSCAVCLEIWEPQPPGNFRTFPGL